VNRYDIESRSRWHRKAQLTESKRSVNDCKFSPRHLGLKLATGSGDGIIRIYEASDVFTLNFWPLQVNKL
jgi:nucleoporin SEH1